LQIRFLDGGDIVVRYTHNGNAIEERYVLLEVKMERAIEAERQRRAEPRTRTSPGRNLRLLLGPATGVRTLDPEPVFNPILAILDTIWPGFGPQRPALGT
jgi:hypothetical protein